MADERTIIVHPGAVHASTRHDAWTVAAVAVVVYALSSLLHEGLGHGGACVVMHGVPRELSSMHFDCGQLATRAAERIVAAGGTIATLFGGGLAFLLYKRAPRNAVWRYALWLFAAVNLMQGTGYFLYSGVGHIGDWAAVTDGWEPVLLWRAGLAVVGLALYLYATLSLFRALAPLAGEARPRGYRHALRLAVLPYMVGGALEIVAGMRNPGGLALVLISGAAASFGGTSGLAWGPQTLRGPRTPSVLLAVPVVIVKRSWAAIVIAITSAALFIMLFGRGLSFS